MKNICLVLVVIIALVFILPGCDGGDTSLPYAGPIDGDQPDGGGDVPDVPDNGDDVTPPAPPTDGDPDGLQPPQPPVF